MAGKPTLPPITESHPQLVKQWHATKNGALKPRDVSSGSNRKVWWQCAVHQHHAWEAEVRSRALGRGCPYCTNRLASPENNLKVLYPEIAAQWHPTKNGKLKPEDVPAGTTRRAWWRCSDFKDHEWDCTVVNRTTGRGCPFCMGKKIAKSNCLATTHPKVAAEWHPTKNKKLTPKDVTHASNEKAWWQCAENRNHVWFAQISSRTGMERGCPCCAGRQLSKDNSLAAMFPDVAAEFHPKKNGGIQPSEVLAGTHERFWWLCSKSKLHEWEQSPAVRTSNGVGCPYCSGRVPAPDTCLAALYPLIAKQWHPKKNGDLKPTDVTPGSHRKVWWRCSRFPHHRWERVVKDQVYARRDRLSTGCPYCRSMGFGKPKRRKKSWR